MVLKLARVITTSTFTIELHFTCSHAEERRKVLTSPSRQQTRTPFDPLPALLQDRDVIFSFPEKTVVYHQHASGVVDVPPAFAKEKQFVKLPDCFPRESIVVLLKEITHTFLMDPALELGFSHNYL